MQQALAGAADASNAHGYPATVGSADLREAIQTWFRTMRGVDLGAVNAGVVPTVGSKEAVALMASLLHFGTGDVVVQPKVSYPTYEIGTQLAGATVLKVDDVADVESWVNVPGVKAVWVNSPNNPSGGVLGAEWLAEYHCRGPSHRERWCCPTSAMRLWIGVPPVAKPAGITESNPSRLVCRPCRPRHAR